MNDIRGLLFVLLKNALWHTEKNLPYELTEKQVWEIFLIAEAQALQGLIADSLIRNNVLMPKHILFEVLSILEKTKEANRTMNEGVRIIADLMQTNTLDYIVFKGQTVAALYSDPLLRIPGDIDFLVYDYQAAQSIFQRKWRIILPDSFIEKEVAFEHNNITYELHTQLITFRWRSHQQYWEDVMQRSHQSVVLVDGKEVKTLSPNIYAIYVFAHLFFHFIREGIGLRQMCDWAIILDRYKDEIDPSQLSADLEGLGMTKAYRAFGAVLTVHLGLKSFPLALNDRDIKASEHILKDILYYGNFGKPIRKAQLPGWKFKTETMFHTIRNCWKYFRLAPKEIGMIIPKQISLNIKIIIP